MTIPGRWFKTGFIIFLVLANLLVPAALAADQGSGNQITTLTPVPDLNGTGVSLANLTVPPEYQNTPSPITVFKVEVTASSLPGPRDMAYGPSVIGLSADPRTLGVIIIAIVIAGAGWYVYSRKRNKGN